jgi:hypothetical protein
MGLLSQLEAVLAAADLEGVTVVRGVIPGPATRRVHVTTLSSGAIEVRDLTLRERTDRSGWIAGLLIRADGVPGEIHVLDVDEKGQTDQLIVRLLEPAGYHPTGHDSYWTVAGEWAGRGTLATTKSAETALREISSWVHVMRTNVPTGPAITEFGSGRQAQTRKADVDGIDANQVDRLWRDGRMEEALSAGGIACLLPHDELPEIDRPLRSLLADIDPRSVLWNAPRAPNGRILTGARILLMPLRDGKPNRRRPWVVIRTRGGAPKLSLSVEHLFDDHSPHRWDVAPWLWRRDRDAVDLASLDVQRLAANDLAVRSLDNLLAGKLIDAFEMCGVGVADRLRRLATGHMLGYGEPGANQDWVNATSGLLGCAAPWLIPSRAVPYLRESYARNAVSVPLKALPNQRWARKAKVVLVVTRESEPYLDIEWTGSNRMLPWPVWRRPLDVDLAWNAARGGGYARIREPAGS